MSASRMPGVSDTHIMERSLGDLMTDIQLRNSFPESWTRRIDNLIPTIMAKMAQLSRFLCSRRRQIKQLDQPSRQHRKTSLSKSRSWIRKSACRSLIEGRLPQKEFINLL